MSRVGLFARPSLDLVKLQGTDLDPLGAQPRYDRLQILGHLVVVEKCFIPTYTSEPARS